MQDYFRLKKWTLFASSVCDFIFELPYTSVESYARLYVKQGFIYFRMVRRRHVHISYHVPGIYTAASSSYCCRRSLQQVPRSYCAKKKVTPSEQSHGHHLPARAASARGARGRCFDLKRAATAPRCRACSASRTRRVGSLVGQDQTQGNSSTRSSSTTPDDGSHPPHRPPPMPQ